MFQTKWKRLIVSSSCLIEPFHYAGSYYLRLCLHAGMFVLFDRQTDDNHLNETKNGSCSCCVGWRVSWIEVELQNKHFPNSPFGCILNECIICTPTLHFVALTSFTLFLCVSNISLHHTQTQTISSNLRDKSRREWIHLRYKMTKWNKWNCRMHQQQQGI